MLDLDALSRIDEALSGEVVGRAVPPMDPAPQPAPSAEPRCPHLAGMATQ